MFHISDLKKINRCQRLFALDQAAPPQDWERYVRLDEQVTDLAAQMLGVTDPFLGQRNDPPELAMQALKEKDWLIKARFEYRNLRIKAPFLHRNGDGWDLYFLFPGLYPHADDLLFYCAMVWVLEHLGIHLKNIRMVHLNREYQRKGDLDVKQLFTVTDYFYNAANHPTVLIREAIADGMRDYTSQLDAMEKSLLKPAPSPVRKPRCASRQKCRFYEECFPEEQKEPCNSILTLIGSRYRYEMKAEGRYFLKDADLNRIEGTRQQFAQIRADQNGGLFADHLGLSAWLSDIRYPISFLDFEWECYAVPQYEGMHPYDVLPFEYSLHIMQKDGTMTHQVFLGIHDDRRKMVESLLNEVPSEGTIIAYNAEGAEKIRLQEFADQFPEYRERLLDMKARMKDLQVPFTSGLVYDTRMGGAWNLKRIMSMMDDPGYRDLDIHEGMAAVFAWRHLDRGDEEADQEQIIRELKEYCGMDSYAMTVVYRWLTQIA